MKKKYLAVSILIFLAAAVCAGVGIRQYLKEKNAGDGYSALRAEVGTGVPKEKPEDSGVEIPIDFAALQSKKSGYLRMDHNTGDGGRLSHRTE